MPHLLPKKTAKMQDLIMPRPEEHAKMQDLMGQMGLFRFMDTSVPEESNVSSEDSNVSSSSDSEDSTGLLETVEELDDESSYRATPNSLGFPWMAAGIFLAAAVSWVGWNWQLTGAAAAVPALSTVDYQILGKLFRVHGHFAETIELMCSGQNAPRSLSCAYVGESSDDFYEEVADFETNGGRHVGSCRDGIRIVFVGRINHVSGFAKNNLGGFLQVELVEAGSSDQILSFFSTTGSDYDFVFLQRPIETFHPVPASRVLETMLAYKTAGPPAPWWSWWWSRWVSDATPMVQHRPSVVSFLSIARRSSPPNQSAVAEPEMAPPNYKFGSIAVPPSRRAATKHLVEGKCGIFSMHSPACSMARAVAAGGKAEFVSAKLVIWSKYI